MQNVNSYGIVAGSPHARTTPIKQRERMSNASTLNPRLDYAKQCKEN
jgi:hypothetical protein